MIEPLSKEAAIRRLRSLAKRWPPELWLFAAAGRLCVMEAGPDGERMHTGQYGGYDPDYEVDAIGIPCDGGDW